MPTHLELQSMIENIAIFAKSLAELFEKLFEGLTLKFAGYESIYDND